ncbi:hypothetical protein SRB17_71740 [Streptomyces sp. RB17]|uniref:golvesin C-terminal-like domain-containing protein n=1 Tax=Streptomyces sp. RB17 TaxID=2585197 RepID=UPI00130AAC03|nr:Tat pathway signal protein [Streptomyces sp. RB17]MQY39152.1 hypothetical protein [Streptomyces sp. RB17]
MRPRTRIRAQLAAVAACSALAGGLVQAAPALGAPQDKPAPSHAGPAPTGRVTQPDKKLGKGWRTSRDRAVTAAADTDGLHVLVADSATAYAWKTAAVLSEPGMPADSWIGNQCVIDHDHAAVVYAPRSFTNKPDLMQGGAFAAIVNLGSGRVTKLSFTASLAYFDPSCNPGTRTAAFTAFRDMNDPAATRTRVVTVNSAGRTLGSAATKGEVTSAVPVADGTVAALGRRLVHIDRSGKARNLLTAGGLPFDIQPATGGGIAFVERDGGQKARARVWKGHGTPATVATGKLGAFDLERGGGAQVFLTGKVSGTPHTRGTGVTRVDAPADTDISSQGRLAVDPVLTPGMRAGVARIRNAGKGFAKTDPSAPSGTAQAPGTLKDAPVTVTSTATLTGVQISQKVTGARASAGQDRLSPALTRGSTQASGSGGHAQSTRAAADVTSIVSHDPTDPDRWCSVSRNDVGAQALQPTPNQVEWAVDMAVRGDLHAGYLNQGGYRNQTGLGTIDPQSLFPPPTLIGGGRIPANVMLGIMAQESNLWQAESGAIPGQMGNPLAAVDGYYGHQIDPGDPDSYWNINWDKSDCGYGVGQVTDGMRLAGHEKPGETSLSPSLQKAVALDYATNIAASLKILADKWNEVHTDGQKITVNNDDPSRVENWFAAVWNYNLGFNPPSDASQHNGYWGLGWYNNPANPIYKNSWGHPFMDTDVDGTEANHDAAHPQDWPYEEKVMGWAAWSIDTGYSYATSGRQDWPGESGFSSAGFRPAWWTSTAQRSQVSPPLSTFCNSDNNCDPTSPPNCGTEECYAQYWWNKPNATWKTNCDNDCGHELIKYQTLIQEPGRGYRLKNGTPVCSGAPAGSQVVASVPNGTETWSDCGQITSSGTFQFTFYADTLGTHYEAKADLHQIGGGYGGHFWYAHARDAGHLGGDGGLMTIDGAWKLNQPLPEKQAMVYVHIPDTGAQTKEADYEVVTAFGTKKVTIDQSANEANKWVPLGAFRFNGVTPEVRLSNTTSNGTADDDIAWGAVAFVPGDYSGMPSITFPNPDDTAPMPSWAGDVEEAHRNTGLPSAALAKALSTGTSGSTCSKTDKKGKKLCLNIGRPTGEKSALAQRANKALSANGIDSLVPWCDERTSGHDWYTRTDACLKAITPLNVVFTVDDKVVGTASFAMKQEIKLYNNVGEFDQLLSLVPTEIDPTLGSVTLGWSAGSTCSDCTQSQQQTDGGLTWLGPEDDHVGNVSFQTLWNGTGKDTITLGWSITGQISAYPEASDEADLGNTLGDLDVRCDDITKGATNAGCVFPAYTPTYTVNTDRYPAAGAYYWLMKEKNSHHFGSREHNAPLHYLANGQQNNRSVVCPDSWVGRSETPDASCDEYAFATTYESGGMPDSGVTSGDQCAQFYATPLNDTTWTIHDDDDYDLPTWSEKCGRASIPLAQNTGALAPFGRTGGFVPYNRMLDDDPFWLATPGFDHCTASDVTCTWQRTSP